MLQRLRSFKLQGLRNSRRRQSSSRRLAIEGLEDRCLMAANVLQTNLVSDLPGVAQFQDPNLVNPWGISESAGPKGSPFWIADNGSSLSTLYNTAGVAQSLVVSIPTPGDPTGASGTPDGTVFNIGPAGSLSVSGVNAKNQPASGKSIFLFVTEDGTIIGWNPGVNPVGFDPTKAGTYATLAVNNSGNNLTNPDPLQQTGAVYKGLAIASGTASATNPNGLIFSTDANSQTVIYVTNFRAGTVEVYDTTFGSVKLPTGAFVDPNLPKGYAPFNVQELGGKIYVTYAKQNDAKHDDVAGEHHGFVDVFNLDGSPGLAGGNMRLVSRGALNSPWGLALAPSTFGTLAGDLLVGNFGDGRINVYNPTTGTSLGGLVDPDGEPIQIDGLWALKVGNGANGGDAGTVYFTAGLLGESHGLFGSLAPVAAGTPEGPAEEQMVHAVQVAFQNDVTTLINDILSGASRDTIKQDRKALDAIFNQLKEAEHDLIHDEFSDGNATAARAHIKELATDEAVFEAIQELFENGQGDQNDQ
jgi:uncharacterized protein (TIGR03118 family)